MTEIVSMVLFVFAYFILMRYVLPRFGVPT
jgi:hypothetical protein